jgi:hypothetical protein
LIKLILKGDWDNRTIFHTFTESENQAKSGTQLLAILKFLKHSLNLENEFLLKQILFNVDRRSKSVFLNIFSRNQDEYFYSNFYDFLQNDLGLTHESWKKYLVNSKYFLFSIAQNNKSTRDQIIKLFEEKLDKSFFSADFYSTDTLHKICENYSKSDTTKTLIYFNFVEEKNGFESMKNYISRKNSKSQTILAHFHHFYSELIQVLEWFAEKFRNVRNKNFLENFLTHVDENGDTFLLVFLKKCPDYSQTNVFFTDTFKFLIENFDKSFAKNLLLIQNRRLENCLNLICQSAYEKEISKVLDLLLKDFQNDQEFFKKLLNGELKKNETVRKWIENNLNFIDLPQNASQSNDGCTIC